MTPAAFPLSWSHYVRLMSVEKPHARAFYETEVEKIHDGRSVVKIEGKRVSLQRLEREIATLAWVEEAAVVRLGDRRADLFGSGRAH